ncbi:DUF397 domain-containing protein [Streptomonospora wellingtoniae]|uniref:DUF397 domain-containing protein n=1 Tax=Streptomonospora wellingtoniae TaxID=3075544 RepID=A0ABU2KUR1_9ACTN|nr:DUF397 domain-containing protein [Streptomonospora sp. DSM 45055]MDT0302798.1 DUF397 domain-containing protein [Streptomonospora sp. DSM 45055]
MHSSIPDSQFRKSSYSQPNGSNCVEIADLVGGSAVRDTQHRHLGHLEFPADAWQEFLADVKDGRL